MAGARPSRTSSGDFTCTLSLSTPGLLERSGTSRSSINDRFLNGTSRLGAGGIEADAVIFGGEERVVDIDEEEMEAANVVCGCA